MRALSLFSWGVAGRQPRSKGVRPRLFRLGPGGKPSPHATYVKHPTTDRRAVCEMTDSYPVLPTLTDFAPAPTEHREFAANLVEARHIPADRQRRTPGRAYSSRRPFGTEVFAAQSGVCASRPIRPSGCPMPLANAHARPVRCHHQVAIAGDGESWRITPARACGGNKSISASLRLSRNNAAALRILKAFASTICAVVAGADSFGWSV